MKLNKLVCLALIVCLTVLSTGTAVSEKKASDVFESMMVSLTASKSVSFSAVAKTTAACLSVSSCKLYKFLGVSWHYVCDLPLPSAAYNTMLYSAYMDYASYIGTGIYRIYVVFSADGNTDTQYSNQRTFTSN